MPKHHAPFTLPEGGSALLVDDNEQHLNMLAITLRARGFEVFTTANPEDAEGLYARHRPEVVVLDLTMAGMDGLEVLRVLRLRDPAAAVILLSAFIDVPTSVRAIHGGAEDVLLKPAEIPHLVASMMRAIEQTRLVRLHRAAIMQHTDTLALLDDDRLMPRVRRALQEAASSGANLLLQGETGTGKTVAAQLVHRLSPRASGAFISVACGSLSADTVECELFGAAEGTIQAKQRGRRGLIEAANGGTLLLDDVGDLPLELQPMLLAVIDDGGYRRIGASGTMSFDVRVIAATNHDLREAVKRGTMRADFFYRLSTMEVTIPSLRARGPEAIAALIARVLQTHQAQVGRGPTRVSDAAMAVLVAYRWPGNLRELRGVIEHAFPFALDAERMEVGHLPLRVRGGGTPSVGPTETYAPTDDADLSITAAERRHIARVLSGVGGNRSRAARILGIARNTLYAKIEAYGLGEVGYD